jgi:hypothetical protein
MTTHPRSPRWAPRFTASLIARSMCLELSLKKRDTLCESSAETLVLTGARTCAATHLRRYKGRAARGRNAVPLRAKHS